MKDLPIKLRKYSLMKMRTDLPMKMEDLHANIAVKHSVKTFMQLAMKRNRAKKANRTRQKPKSRKKFLIHVEVQD